MTGLINGVYGNLVGTAAAPIDPLLGPLADNGGPTQTLAVLAGSPALDAGNNALSLNFDQRGAGFARVSGTAADIGAFEHQVSPPAIGDQCADQRRRCPAITVDRVSVTFDQHVSLPADPASAFQLKRQFDNAVVTLAAAVDDSGSDTVVTLTFTGGPVQSGSLADGRYTLTVAGGTGQ